MEKHVRLTERIIGAAMQVHRVLGPGFLESVYQRALALELSCNGLVVEEGRPLKVIYAGMVVGDYTPDLLVEGQVVVELKAVQTLVLAHEVQTVHYLTATGIEVGLLINFGAALLQFKRKHPDRHARYAPVHPVSIHPVNPVQSQTPARGAVIDITHPHANSLAPWPGDTPFNFQFSTRIRDGATCNVGRLHCSIHTGTHADAPYHYNDAGATIDTLAPDIFIGPARVFAAQGRDVLTREVFAGLDANATPRVLVRTNACDDKSVFPRRIPTLAPDVPAWLGAQGVRLIGLDVPSVDQVDSKTLPIHHALDAAGIIIIENLDLRAVTPGIYELISLPLKIAGGDGSPLRAVLRVV